MDKLVTVTTSEAANAVIWRRAARAGGGRGDGGKDRVERIGYAKDEWRGLEAHLKSLKWSESNLEKAGLTKRKITAAPDDGKRTVRGANEINGNTSFQF